MAGEKEVILKLRAVSDPRNAQILGELGGKLNKTQGEIFNIEKRGTAAVVGATSAGIDQSNRKIDAGLKARVDKHKAHYEQLLAMDRAYHKARQQLAGKLTGAIGAAQASGSPEDAAKVTAIAAEGQKLLKEHEKIQRQITAIQRAEAGKRLGAELKAQREQEEAARASLNKRLETYKRTKAAEEKELARFLAKAKRDQDKAWADEQRKQERAAQEAKRALEREAQEKERIHARNDAIRARRLSEEIRSSERSAAARAQHLEKLRSSTREMMETAGESSEAIMKIMRGTVALGLVGEKNLDKIRDRLLMMQAAFDLISGSVKILLNMEKAMYAYRNATMAAAAAQGVLASSQAAAGTTGGAGLLGGLASGVGGMFAGRAARRAAQEAARRTAEVAAMREAAMLGTNRAAAAGTVVGGVGAAAAPTAAASFGPLAAGGAALAGTAFGSVGAWGSIMAAREAGIMGGARKGSATDMIGGSDLNPFSWMFGGFAKMSRNRSTTATEKLEEKSKQIQAGNLADHERRLVLEQEILSIRNRQAEIARGELETQLGGMEATKKRQALAIMIRRAEHEITEKVKEAAKIGEEFEELRALREADVEAARERHLALVKQAQQVEREIMQEKKAAAQEELSKAKEVLRTTEQQLKTEQDKFKTAQERFATMDKSEQAEVLRLNNKMRVGQDLRGDELQKLAPFRDLPGFKEKFDASIGKAATAGGFGSIGSEAQKHLTELEGKVKAQKDVVASVETRINVTLKMDEIKLEKKLADEMKKAQEQVVRPMLERLGKVEQWVTETENRIRNRATGG